MIDHIENNRKYFIKNYLSCKIDKNVMPKFAKVRKNKITKLF